MDLIGGIRLQKAFASDEPVVTPSTSRHPSVLMPTAIIVAVETMRPAATRLHIGRVNPEVGPGAPRRHEQSMVGIHGTTNLLVAVRAQSYRSA